MVTHSAIKLPFGFIGDLIAEWQESHDAKRRSRRESEERRQLDRHKTKFESIAAEELSHFVAQERNFVYKTLEDDATLAIRTFCNLRKDEQDRRMDEEDRRHGRQVHKDNRGVEVRVVCWQLNLTYIYVSSRNHKRRWKRWYRGCILP